MDNTIIGIGDKCFGCRACEQGCAHRAITMKYTDEGFLYPLIDPRQCVNCGICRKLCPATGQSFVPQMSMPKCFAAFSDNEHAMQSSSGGVFSILAEHVLNSGGVVCGAAFDDDWLVAHKIVSDRDGLAQLRTSKYLQSDTNRTYSEIKELLAQSRPILFSGTPCQVAGLYGFLGSDDGNLLTVDLFCHGVPSPKVWESYLQETIRDKHIKCINFRDKTRAIVEDNIFNTTIGLEDKNHLHEGEWTFFSTSFKENIFMRGFLQNLFLRKSCSTCKYATTPRLSDISLGDFWGYEKVDKQRDTRAGLSAILINTDKGEKALDIIKSKLQFLRSVPLETIISGNPVLKMPCKAHENRFAFMKDFARLAQGSVSRLIEKYLGDRTVGILNFAPFSVHNYGAVLVAYAMEHAIERFEYQAYTINFVPEHMLFLATSDNAFTRFRRKFLKLTGICTSKAQLGEQIGSRFNRLCIGSDQVVRAEWHFDFNYYLDWANGKKSLFSYAASFGMSDLNMSADDHSYAKKCVDRFDAFSVREHSGADIMKRAFDKTTPVVCDPTMLLGPEDYKKIIDTEASLILPEEYVACYFLHETPEILEPLTSKYPVIDAYKGEDGNYRSVGDWLNIIKNAKYVVTDSFHGSAFSIIYQKQFFVLPTQAGGNERLTTLMSFLGQDRIVTNGIPITEELFAQRIDYNNASARLAKMKKDGYAYLEAALAIKPHERPPIMDKGVSKRVLLLNLIEILKIHQKKNKTYVRFLGFLPLLKIKNNKIYLFGFLRIAKTRGM